jgi:Mn-dependent DtxR family transcriptional regulator
MPMLTEKQGQVLAFIHLYTKLNSRPPAEADIQRYFRVSPASVRAMLLRLEMQGLISREPRKARSIRVLLPPEELPDLKERNHARATQETETPDP